MPDRDIRRGKKGFILVELLVFSLLLGAVFGGVAEIAGLAVRGARAVCEHRNGARAFSSLVAEIRAGTAEKIWDGGGRHASVSGGGAPLARQTARVEAAGFGAADDAVLSWCRRDIRCRE